MEDTDPSDDPKLCEHKSGGNEWLPILKGHEEDILALHPYCGSCGLVRNIGPDRAKRVGRYTEALSEVERFLKHESEKGARYKLTECQKRLIVKTMEQDDIFTDLYGTLASAQEERFVEIVQKYRPDLKKCEIEYHLD